MFKWIAILVLLASTMAQNQPFVSTSITDNWVMSFLSGPNNIDKIREKTYPTSIPTTLHLVLENAGDIPNPFLKENYPTLKYVSDCSVKFSVNFTVD
jgi:hypothetical protein